MPRERCSQGGVEARWSLHEGQAMVGSFSETDKCRSYMSSLFSLLFLFHPAEVLDGPEFP